MKSLALALAIALVFAAHRYRVTQMVNLERMRTAIATDLHDDIGASLSQIAILSEVARVGGNGQGRPGEPLERVATLARELVDSMGDVVWSIRSEPARHGLADPAHARICARSACQPGHRFRACGRRSPEKTWN